MENNETLKYPFNNLTIEQLMDIANKINIRETNHGRTTMVEIKGNYIDRSNKEFKDYICMVSYIKFIVKEIEVYQESCINLKNKGLEVPTIYQFVNGLITKTEQCINSCINKNKRPWPIDILSNLNQITKVFEFNLILYDVIDLLLKEKNYCTKAESATEIEELDSSYIKKDLSEIVNELLNDLEIKETKKLILSIENK